MIFLLLFASLLFNFTEASREDATISLNERFNNILFQHPSYDAFEFPYGLDFKQIIKLNDKEVIVFANHVYCIPGKPCDTTKVWNYFLQINLEDISIVKKTILPRLLADEAHFQPRIINGNIQMINYIDPKLYVVQLINIPVQYGNITNYFPRDSEYFIGFVGATSETAMRTYVLNLLTRRVDVFTQQLIREYSIKLDENLSKIVNIALDSKRSFLYVLLKLGEDLTLFRYRRPTVNQTFVSSVVIPVEDYYLPQKVIVGPSGDVFIGLRPINASTTNYTSFDQYILKKINLELRVVQTISFFMKVLIGHFFDAKNDILYVYGNSELAKINETSKDMKYVGTMNFRSSRVRYITNKTENNVPIDSGMFYDENTAYFGSKAHGIFYKVYLNKFLDQKNDYPSDQMAIIQAFTLLGISTIFTLFVICCLGTVICCLGCKRKQTYESLE